LGIFDGERGVYDLDVEVLKDASCLNSAHPRLKVSAFTSSYADFYALQSGSFNPGATQFPRA
jgi:hypothetical protein